VIEEELVGERVAVESPQSRFAAEAAVLTGRTLEAVTAHGKHLFLHFGGGRNVHVHLGLYGWLHFGGDPTPSTRMRIEGRGGRVSANLVAPTACQLWTDAEVAQKKAALGPDPIHAEADPERALAKIRKSKKKSIASLLMDQSVVAGIGNVYRAEVLFMTKTDPFTLGGDVTEGEFVALWDLSRALLRDGSRDGKVRTVLRQHMSNEEVKLHGCAQSSYVYKRTGSPCRVCGEHVRQAAVDGRALYWCPSCQGS
jgi:endonuclease-8